MSRRWWGPAPRTGAWVGGAVAVAVFAGCNALLGLEDLSGPDVGAGGAGADGGAGGTLTSAGSNVGAAAQSSAASATAGPGGSGADATCASGEVEVFAKGEPQIGRVAVGETHVYWTTFDGIVARLRSTLKDGTGTPADLDSYTGVRSDALVAEADLVCWAKNTEPVEVVCRHDTRQPEHYELPDVQKVVSMAFGANYVWVTTIPVGVWAIDLARPTSAQEIPITIDAGGSVEGIDGKGSTICFAQQLPNGMRCYAAATKMLIDSFPLPDNVAPTGVAIGQQSTVYVADPGAGTVVSTLLSNRGVDLVAGEQVGLGDIIADTSDVYWTSASRSGQGASVRRWTQDTEPDTDVQMIDGLVDPLGLAADELGVYVTDGGPGAVYRCDL